jgi:hypothetical protein
MKFIDGLKSKLHISTLKCQRTQDFGGLIDCSTKWKVYLQIPRFNV